MNEIRWMREWCEMNEWCEWEDDEAFVWLPSTVYGGRWCGELKEQLLNEEDDILFNTEARQATTHTRMILVLSGSDVVDIKGEITKERSVGKRGIVKCIIQWMGERGYYKMNEEAGIIWWERSSSEENAGRRNCRIRERMKSEVSECIGGRWEKVILWNAKYNK